MEKGVEMNRTTLEEVDPQKGGGKEKCQLHNLMEGRIANLITAAERRCLKYYGFASNPTNPPWTTITNALRNINPNHYFARPSNNGLPQHVHEATSTAWSR
jgi:hypothetical protein